MHHQVESLLFELVSVPSVNPLLQDEEVTAEREVGAMVQSLLEDARIDVQRQEVSDGRFNVIGHIKGAGPSVGSDVLLSAHMDTYPIPSAGPSAKANISDGTLFGRGSCDAKASLAAMLVAFIEASKAPRRRGCYLAATVDEEVGLTGVKRLAELGIRPDLAITGEPTSLIPIIGQKGIVRTDIDVYGAVSHAAYPDFDNSAVIGAAELVLALKKFNQHIKEEGKHATLGAATVFPVSIQGRGLRNAVANRVRITLDARYLPNTSAGDLLEQVTKFLKHALGDRCSFTIEEPSFDSPPNQCPTDCDSVRDMLDAVRFVTGNCSPEEFSYGSEAGVLAEFSAASLVFGPGDAKFSHHEQEQVRLSEVLQATDIFRRLLCG